MDRDHGDRGPERAIAMKHIMLVVAGSLISASGQVWAGPDSGPVCELVEPGFVSVDGMLEDWRDIAGQRVGGLGRNASLSLRCVYDRERLFVAVDVRDQDVVRQPGNSGKRAEDRLGLRLAAGGPAVELEAFPGVDDIEPRRRWNRRALAGSGQVEVEDTLQEHGWSLELAVPMEAVAGLGPGAPGVSARIAYRDADRGGKGRAVEFSGTLVFRAGAEALRGFLGATKLAAGDLRLDVTADFDGAPGVERVVAGGTAIGVITDGYAYMTLPVASPRDVRQLEAVDLRGDGTLSILTVIRQHGNGGSRDLLTVWGVAGRGRFERILAVEVRKQLGARKMRNRWSLAPAAGKGGQDILVEVGPGDVRGWSEESYLETPAPDVRPILQPWGEETAVRFSFEGNVVMESQPEARRSGKPRRRGPR